MSQFHVSVSYLSFNVLVVFLPVENITLRYLEINLGRYLSASDTLLSVPCGR